MCPALSPSTTSQTPAHTCSTPCTTDTATTLDSLVGPPASVTSVILCSLLCPLSLLSMLLLPRLLAVMMKMPFCASPTILLWFRVMVMLRFLFRTPVFLAFPPPPPLLLFALNLPWRPMPSRVWLIPICFFFWRVQDMREINQKGPTTTKRAMKPAKTWFSKEIFAGAILSVDQYLAPPLYSRQ
jgi:hypothetical protein